LNKRVLITGIYGQDGSFLAEKFYEKKYEIHGICKADLSENSKSIKRELESRSIEIIEHPIDLYDHDAVAELIDRLIPDYIFHMAAIHRSANSLQNNNVIAESELFRKNVAATENILEGCAVYSRNSRIVTAGSCLMFDDTETERQSESTAFSSDSLYGIAKITENQLVRYYRRRGLFACTAILYNHESHRRGTEFVTRKIAEGLKAIQRRDKNYLELGNIDIEKDWGFAGDYVDAMILMADAGAPEDYVLSSGKLHTIREYIECCADLLGIDNWNDHIRCNTAVITRGNKARLFGDSKLIEGRLGWKRKYDFTEMVREIIGE